MDVRNVVLSDAKDLARPPDRGEHIRLGDRHLVTGLDPLVVAARDGEQLGQIGERPTDYRRQASVRIAGPVEHHGWLPGD